MITHTETLFSVAGCEGNYVFGVYDDYQIIFYSTHTYLDEAFFVQEVGSRRMETEPGKAIRVFRKVEKLVKSFLYERKPPFLRYNVGFDLSRCRLYRRLAEKFREVGYRPLDIGSDREFLILRDAN